MESTRHQSYVIQSIVKRARPELNNEHLYVPKNVVDINLHVSDLHTLLDMESNEVCMVGICRFGEIGKMTFAKATYNAFACKFYCCSFLSNVRETCEKSQKVANFSFKRHFFLRELIKWKQYCSSWLLLKYTSVLKPSQT